MSEPTRDHQSAQKPRRRGIYLLPNLFTTAGLFSGFYAIISAINGDFQASAVAIFIAMIMDGLDGRVARMTNTQSDFGVEYDSLSDMVCFGVAPALVIFQWALIDEGAMGRLGWLAAFVYTAGAALRLARFNIQVGTSDRRFFRGLPSPAAAGVIAGGVWAGTALEIQGNDLFFIALVITIALGGLMVSNVMYYSFKDMDFIGRVPFFWVLAVVLVFTLASIDPPKVLFGFFLLYALSGPIYSTLRFYKRTTRSNPTP